MFVKKRYVRVIEVEKKNTFSVTQLLNGLFKGNRKSTSA